MALPPGTGTHFFVTVDALDNSGNVIKTIDSSTKIPLLRIKIENTTNLTRDAKVEAVLTNAGAAELWFRDQTTRTSQWDPEFRNVTCGKTMIRYRVLLRNGGSNPAEQIADQLYFQWVTPTWQRDTLYQAINRTIAVS